MLNAVYLAPLLAVLFAFGFNAALLLHLREVTTHLEAVDAGFLISVPFFFVAFFTVLFTLFSFKRMDKIFFIPLILLSSILNYAMCEYGIIFDGDMIQNIFETDYAEATSYLNPHATMWFIGSGIAPAFVLYKTKIIYPPLHRTALQKAGLFFAGLAAIGLIATFYYEDYASVIRNNSDLRRQVVPFYMLGSTMDYLEKTYFDKTVEYRQIALDAHQTPAAADVDSKKDIVVLLVGETQRSMNYQLNGYDRETNPYTKKIGVQSFKHATSCGTATAVSVPCMFSNLTREGYSKKLALSQDNLTDVLQRAGVNVIWIDNNSGCKGVCKNVKTVVNAKEKYGKDPKFCNGEYCYDETLFVELEKTLGEMPHEDTLVALHLAGSHGPTYFERYPPEHKVFTPDCPRSDIQNCSQEALVNTYDNTILYNDYLMGKMIELLEKNKDKWNASLVFMSDHGESLGEKGMYLHGLPYVIAPEEQTHIPFISWFSEGAVNDKKIVSSCVEKIAEENNCSHDNLFHTVLGLFDVQTSAYDGGMDVFRPCRK